MALIWSTQRDGMRYEVRAAGRTRRLYSNGVFHSSYNPARPVTGGGTVIRQLRQFVRPREIVAVDLNPVHLDIARRFFDVQGSDVRLVKADARAWLAKDRSRYDLVIDDLFGERNGEPVRAIDADNRWCRQLRAHACATGAIAINCISPAELAGTGFLQDRTLRNHFRSKFQLRAARDENAVGLFLPHAASANELRRNLLAVPGLNPRRERRLRFSLRTLAG